MRTMPLDKRALSSVILIYFPANLLAIYSNSISAQPDANSVLTATLAHISDVCDNHLQPEPHIFRGL